MTYGLTTTGFNRKTYEQISADIKAFLRERIAPNLVLDASTFEGNLVAAFADELDLVWEASEAAVGALDPDNAVDTLLVALCKLTGVYRRAASQGTVSADLTFNAATTIPAGSLLLAVDGEASNLWANDDEIVATGAGTSSHNFTSVAASSAATALAGTLTVIATPKFGLASATNPLDATPGTDIEDPDVLRLRREASLGVSGKGTVAAIREDVSAVDGVIDVRVIENDTDVIVGSVPPHTIHVIVWDGPTPAADDGEIAQAIYGAKAAGTPTYGAESETAEDPWGDAKTQYYDRATEVEAYVSVTVVGATTEAAVKAALLESHNEFIGESLLYAGLISAAFGVEGVTNVTSLTLGTAPAPAGTADITATSTQVVTLDTSRITVTIA